MIFFIIYNMLVYYIIKLNIHEQGQMRIKAGSKLTALICLICAIFKPKTKVSNPPTAMKSLSIAGVVRGIINCAQ